MQVPEVGGLRLPHPQGMTCKLEYYLTGDTYWVLKSEATCSYDTLRSAILECVRLTGDMQIPGLGKTTALRLLATSLGTAPL